MDLIDRLRKDIAFAYKLAIDILLDEIDQLNRMIHNTMDADGHVTNQRRCLKLLKQRQENFKLLVQLLLGKGITFRLLKKILRRHGHIDN